jgi:hypothetical protein
MTGHRGVSPNGQNSRKRAEKGAMVEVSRAPGVVMSVPAPRVRVRQPAQEGGQFPLHLRPKDQMPLRGHETVGQHPGRVFLPGFRKDTQEGLGSAGLLEQRQAGHGAVNQTTGGIARVAGHGRSLPTGNLLGHGFEPRPLSAPPILPLLL